MKILVDSPDYVKIDRGFGVETLSRDEFDTLVAPHARKLKPELEPELEPEPEMEAGVKADVAPPADKSMRPQRKK